jgi:hypothetical protein
VKEKFTENLDEGSDLSGERAFESHGAPQQTKKFESGSHLRSRSRDLRHVATQFSFTQPILVATLRAFLPQPADICTLLGEQNESGSAVIHPQTGQNRGSNLNGTREMILLRHCEPPGRRSAPPNDRLSEAIQHRTKIWIASR